jgi:hypothetical protein
MHVHARSQLINYALYSNITQIILNNFLKIIHFHMTFKFQPTLYIGNSDETRYVEITHGA